MTEPFSQILHDWQNFYQLVGESSATLTGLMFIAASLGTSLIDDKAGPKVRTFITPTIIYFSVVLLISALMNIPNQTSFWLSLQLGIIGLFGTIYSASHFPRLRGFELEPDARSQVWIWNFVLPLLASLWLLGAALDLRQSAAQSLDAAAVGVLLFVLIGLHNAWSVTLRLVRLTPS